MVPAFWCCHINNNNPKPSLWVWPALGGLLRASTAKMTEHCFWDCSFFFSLTCMLWWSQKPCEPSHEETHMARNREQSSQWILPTITWAWVWKCLPPSAAKDDKNVGRHRYYSIVIVPGPEDTTMVWDDTNCLKALSSRLVCFTATLATCTIRFT